ncbi:MAG: hypothetical protein WD066_16475 [Planctomycetaceae bacterium]
MIDLAQRSEDDEGRRVPQQMVERPMREMAADDPPDLSGRDRRTIVLQPRDRRRTELHSHRDRRQQQRENGKASHGG